MFYFYSKEKNSRLLGSLAYSKKDVDKYLGGNYFAGYPNLNNNNTAITEKKLSHPTWTGNELREMTKLEICQILGDLSVLVEGEVYQNGTIIKKEPSDDLFSPKWEYPNWLEGATDEEIELAYKTKINELKAETLEEGFKFIKDGEHQQKNRDKDRTLLTSSISSMKRQGKDKIDWSFNDGDIVELTLEEMQRMEDEGFVITQAVFAVEAQLKSQSPTNNLTLEKFKDMVDAISTIKCWRV